MSVTGPLVIPDLPGAGGANATLKQLRERVYMGLRDSDGMGAGVFIPPGQVDTFLNEGYVDLVTRLKLNRAEVTGTTTTTATIPLPTGYVEVDSLIVGDEVPLEVDDDTFNSWKVADSIPFSTIYRIFGTNIELYPVDEAESADYILRYVKVPTYLVADGDLFTALPLELEVRLVNYARAHCRWIEGDMQDGDRYMSVYRTGLPDYPRAARRFGKGPTQLIPAPSPFDA